MNPYPNINMPLNSGVARCLIYHLFAGKDPVKRADIIRDVTHYHNKNGGAVTEKKKRVNAVKKALRDHNAEGIAEKHPSSTGFWRRHKAKD